MSNFKENIRQRRPGLFAILKLLNRFRKRILKPLRVFAGPVRYLRFRAGAWRMARVHRSELRRIRGKAKVRIVFIIIHPSTWKLDTVFERMLAHPRMEPCIVVARDEATAGSAGAQWADDEARRCFELFTRRGWEVYRGSSLNEDAAEHISNLERLSPDFIFFNNPHGMTDDRFFCDAYTKRLTCYCPYHCETTTYNSDQNQYNSEFHNLMWRIFCAHRESAQVFERTQAIKGRNVLTTGYPLLEQLSFDQDTGSNDAWKAQPKKKLRIIWAPHWGTGSGPVPRTSFYDFSELFRDLAEEYADCVQWAFKPHPLLRPHLEKLPEWGVARTRDYFEYWRSQPHTQLEQGDYIDLFRGADALLHDSYSFLAEFLFLDKPAVFVRGGSARDHFLNGFGKACFDAHQIVDEPSALRGALQAIVDGNDPMKERRQKFVESYFAGLGDTVPSALIVKEIEKCLEPSA